MRLIENLASRFLGEWKGETDSGCLWGLLWASPWLPAALGILRGQSCQALLHHLYELGLSSDAPELLARVWPGAYAGLTGQDTSPQAPLRKMLPSFPKAGALADWLKRQTEALHAAALLGVVITGPLADVLYEGKSLGERWLAKVGVSCERVLMEGRDVPRGILAGMAATHSMRLAGGLPTYLDTLPRVKMVVTKAGEPIWADLLQENDAYVDGGQEWHREEVGKGLLSIMENKAELPIDLNHEEYPTVRTVTPRLPEACRSRAPISLSVAVMPAHGNARVEVVPETPGALGRYRLLVDWGTMDDTKNTPEEWLEGLPRICPPVTVRLQSWDRWKAVRFAIRQFMQDRRPLHAMQDELKQLRHVLQQQDQFRRNTYPIGSDGTVPLGEDDLSAFVDRLVEYLVRPRGDCETKEAILHVLAHTFTADHALQQYLVDAIGRTRSDLDQHHLLAIGRCLRESKVIGMFAVTTLRKLSHIHVGVNNWLRALSEAIKYREDATQHIGSDVCLTLTKHLLDIFEASFDPPEQLQPMVFRHSCVSIVYLLRRRVYEDNYLDPAHPLAQRGKKLFSLARKYDKSGEISLPGGMVNLQDELQNLIDYIDRRGRGAIVMASIEDA